MRLSIVFVIANSLAISLPGQVVLPGIGKEQSQCWADWNALTQFEREAPLSDLLLEKKDGRCTPIGSPAEWNSKRERIRRSWRLLIGEEPQVAPQPEVRILAEEKKNGYLLRKVEFRSEQDDFVSAYLFVPESLAERAPALIACMPTTPHGKEAMAGYAENENFWYALDLVRRGYVVLAPEVPTTGERIEPGLQPFDTSGFYRKHPTWTIFGKMLWDHQRAVDYLSTLNFVDSLRIGAIGFSLGAHNAALLAAFDERIKAVVSNGGLIPFTGSPNPFTWVRELAAPTAGRVAKFQYMPPLGKYLLAGETPTDMHEMQALIAPRPYLDMNSVSDTWKPGLSAAMKLRRLYKFLGAPENFDYYVFDGPHSFPPPIRERAYRWLDTHLRRKKGR